jgi:translocator protein
MMNDKFRQAAVLVSIGLMIAGNYLSQAGFFGGLTNKDISDKYHTLITPAGYAFAIWGVIFLGMIAFGIYQALPSQRANPRFRAIGGWVILNALANGIWSPIFNNEYISLALLVILVILGSLAVIVERLLARPRQIDLANELDAPLVEFPVSAAETWLARVPFLIYFGWVTVATIVNVAVALKASGFELAGMSESGWAQAVLVVGLVVGLWVFGHIKSVAYLLVFTWAYVAIARENSGQSGIVLVAYIGAAVAAGYALWTLFRRNQTPVYA